MPCTAGCRPVHHIFLSRPVLSCAALRQSRHQPEEITSYQQKQSWTALDWTGLEPESVCLPPAGIPSLRASLTYLQHSTV